MIRIILSGCNGAMGGVISRRAGERGDCEIVAGIDPGAGAGRGYPVFPTAEECDAKADVIIDFSHPSALEGLIALSRQSGIPLVVATTGLSEGQIASIREAAGEIPIFFTFNMSLGVNLMTELAKTAARVLGDQFDMEIVERHHNRKIDAPSGTAVMLANALSEALAFSPQLVYDRQSRRQRRAKEEIGIHSIRGGTIVGEHEVLFAGQDEMLRLIHTASSKEVFATGALNAGLFMAGRAPGLYTMKQLIDGR